MGFQDFISETEASSFTGVSSVTLKRFADAGYLRVEVESDGLRMFSRTELENVFGLTNQSVNASPVASNDGQEHIEIVKDLLLKSQQHSPPAPDIKPTEPTIQETEESKVQTQHFVPAEIPSVSHNEAPRISTALLELEREVSRLRAITELQEKYIDLKEGEVNSLKSERDWLRSRIEKLEEKNDRDQLILVSVSETNRGLITMLEHKKSPIRAALEWVGLLPPPPPAITRPSTTSSSQSS